MPVASTPVRLDPSEFLVNTPASLDLLDPRLRPLCAAILGATQVPGASVAVVMADKGYHFAYGKRFVDTPDPVTLDTGFNIGSCSKAFVSATLASLVAEGLCAGCPSSSCMTPRSPRWRRCATSAPTGSACLARA